MKKGKRIIVSLVLFVILATISVFLYMYELLGYMLVTATLAAIALIVLVLAIIRKSDERSKYEYKLKQIIKKYNSILAETSTLPDLHDKNIMLITNIEDMIDASIEIRKPIYYKKDTNYCSFSLLDNNDICIYILKLYEDEETSIESFIKNRKQNIEDLIENAKDNKLVEDIVSSSRVKRRIRKDDEEVM